MKTKHMQGKRCGYELREDGVIEMAPVYADAYNQLFYEEQAVKKLIENALEHLKTVQVGIEKRRHGLWRDIVDDYGLEKGRPYLIGEGILTPQPLEEEKT